ncbi:hypothetical protein K490DRAFT_16957, partial [Saccharata proteae CBS 121410]
MAQGAIKSKAKASGPKKAFGPARGNRVIAPKKTKLINQKKILKKHTAGLIGATEKQLAQRAGHLEMLKGGKRDEK